MLQIFSKATLIVFLLSSFVGCSGPQIQPYNPETSAGPKQKVFSATYDEVWRAVQLALSHYALKVNDMESGVMETDYVRGDSVWQSPHAPRRSTGGLRYKISVRILKGKQNKTSAIQVTVLKRIEYQRDFFSPHEPVPTDGLEEIAILYRIERELHIQDVLSRVKI